MNREEFQKELSSRFQSTESGFGSMTQRELILLQIASNLYESEVKKFRLGDVVGQSELLFAFIKAVKEEFADQNWDYLDFIADRVIGKQ